MLSTDKQFYDQFINIWIIFETPYLIDISILD